MAKWLACPASIGSLAVRRGDYVDQGRGAPVLDVCRLQATSPAPSRPIFCASLINDRP